ncbi:transcriptional regulator, LacI family [Clostridium cavendishii DSM 21758]|uniref:Transcriptional regulator, LacI family n=1 Tax=Clostridium cavendishii DSM 21758 TaxID=1121302 RepID=A0A1M6RVZ8_9CLOT|nr:LacI family DNA-binding transcriptional regulator [Clostridium cavendishii]SHK36489.1 transcriptional regulator, LacI family [Clostridium cavendishii DSM 21758]
MSKVRLADIAKMANVSKTTVSMVLNDKNINVSEETRKNIKRIAEELNYIPDTVARSLSTKKTNILGIINPDIENPFFSEMVKAIEKKAEYYKYSIILCNSYNDYKKEEKYLKLLISKRVDGVIVLSGGKGSTAIDTLKKNKIPFVVVDRYIESEESYSGVFCDNDKGIDIGVRYLFDKGKRNIAFIRGEEELTAANLRYNAFEKTAKDLGIFNKNLVEEESFTIEGGKNSTQKLMEKKEKVDAIFYSSDVMALGGMKYLIRNGYKVPEDISVLGYDNINIASLIEPELTTIAQPIYEMGKKACELLIEMIDEQKEEKIIYLDPKLVERSTVL